MAIEIVLLTPLLVAIALLVVAGGRLVAVQGQIDSAMRDSAREASLARSQPEAAAAAQAMANAVLPRGANCGNVSLADTDFRSGGSVTTSVRCEVSYAGLGLLGLPGSADVSARSVAPIDLYRRTL